MQSVPEPFHTWLTFGQCQHNTFNFGVNIILFSMNTSPVAMCGYQQKCTSLNTKGFMNSHSLWSLSTTPPFRGYSLLVLYFSDQSDLVWKTILFSDFEVRILVWKIRPVYPQWVFKVKWKFGVYGEYNALLSQLEEFDIDRKIYWELDFEHMFHFD